MRYAHIVITTILMCCSIIANADDIEYTPNDSIRIENILGKARHECVGDHPMLYFGRLFLGTPYVAQTLEAGSKEHLIINTRQLDCTTFVETILALTTCHRYNQTTFRDFCRHLRRIRYRGGEIKDYTSRLHYFTWWGEDNERMGFVKNISRDGFPFTAQQTININYMSTHPTTYKQLKQYPEFIPVIAKYENWSNGQKYPYIPKSLFNKNEDELSDIKTGDIIAIITNKRGLDTSHIGVAVWLNGKLHMMHASSIYKKVVIDKNTFYSYSQRQTSQMGIRVYRVVL